jgi:hypothetical protein
VPDKRLSAKNSLPIRFLPMALCRELRSAKTLPRALEALAASSGSDWRIGDCTALSPAVDRPLAFYYLQPLIRSVRPSRPSPLSPAARRRATIEQHACVIMCFVSLLIAACTHGHGRPLCCTTVHVCLLVSGHYYYPCSLHHFMHSRRLYIASFRSLGYCNPDSS